MTADAEADREVEVDDPLDVALLWTRRVGAIADYWGERARTAPERGESPGMTRIEADIAGAGRQQYEAAQMAAYMAEVSLAVDVRRIADMLTVVPAERVEVVDDDRAEDHWRDAREPGADAYREPGQ